MKLIYRGAEAEVYLNEKKKTVIKKRIPKKYRIRVLDREIRKSRIKKEAKVIHEAKKAGVGAPFIESVDLKKFIIEMSYVSGKRLTELIKEAGDKSKASALEKCFIACNELGKAIAKLHNAGIMHGDLTTSNIIIREEGKDIRIFFIDFGLSEFTGEIEDKGIDLVVLKKCLQALNSEIADKCFGEVLNGYRKISKEAENVIKRINEIEKRGRYISERRIKNAA